MLSMLVFLAISHLKAASSGIHPLDNDISGICWHKSLSCDWNQNWFFIEDHFPPGSPAKETFIFNTGTYLSNREILVPCSEIIHI